MSSEPNNEDLTRAGDRGQHDAGSGDDGHRDHEEANGMKTAKLWLPYHKQGDDLFRCLEYTGSVVKALELHACQMDDAASILRAVKDAVAGQEVSIEADSHVIMMNGPAEMIDDLIGKDVLIAEEDLDEDEEDLDDAPMPNLPKLIQCKVGGLAPWALTCIHVFEGTATVVVPVPHTGGGSVENDWLCEECFEKRFGENADPDARITDFRLVCIHCLKKILEPYQITYHLFCKSLSLARGCPHC